MTKKQYITTTLPYVNAAPHIGHALEFIQADVIVRFLRSKIGSENVWFNIGMDEHGLKIFDAARDAGLTPQEYADKYAAEWKKFCELFLISYDTFYRTTGEAHIEPAQSFWKACESAGDIYKKKYSGLYCIGCEEFKTEKDLENGECPLHGAKIVKHEEENYFFKLSKYRDELLAWLDEKKDALKPDRKVDELCNWIENMEDISISRVKENLPWGIPVPGDDEQVMYVWFDALTNYVNVLGYGTDEKKLDEWWPGIQLFGPDNLRFQGAIWQGMLASAGLEHTAKLLCHGTILASDGTKMSKTKRNVVSPFDQADKYSAEATRFYMISGIATYGDSAYKEEELVSTFNSYLADNYGNLLSRVVHLANAKEVMINNPDVVPESFKAKVDNMRDEAEAFYSDFELQQAAEVINSIAVFGNQYIDENKPWEKDKSKEEIEEILNNLSYLLAVVTKLYEPIIPESTARAKDALEKQEKIILFTKLE